MTIFENRNPTAADLFHEKTGYDYKAGDRWINQQTEEEWILTSVAAGIMIWLKKP